MSAEHIAVLTPHSYLPCRLQGVLQVSLGYLILRGASGNGPVAQLVRASPCHGEGRRFESDLGRHIEICEMGS